MTNQQGDFIWYELMTTDASAAQSFYRGLCGWEFADSGMPDMDYRLFSMAGSMVGGLIALSPEMEAGDARPSWSGYVAVDDVDASCDVVSRLGGQVLMPVKHVPQVGRFAFISDPKGGMLYLMQAESDEPSESFASHAPRVGHCAWNELMTDDPEEASGFYGELFGWVKTDSMDMGPMGEYALYRNGKDRDFMLAGMMARPELVPTSTWCHYFRVPSIGGAAEYIGNNGGQVVIGPMEIPGDEYSLAGIDPQGAFFALVGET